MRNHPSLQVSLVRGASGPLGRLIPVLVVALVLSGAVGQAANLLVNPSFEANSGNVIASGWTYFSPPLPATPPKDYWVEGAVPAHSGSLYWKEWGALYLAAPTNNVAGLYQDFSSTPGSTYQASGWFYTRSSDLLGADCSVWLEVAFLGSSSNLLALYKSDSFSAAVGSNAWFSYQVNRACDLSSPVPTGDPYYTTYAVTGTVSQLVAPLGTQRVRYRFAYLQNGKEGGSCYFDDAVLNQVSGPIPPVINNFFPLNMIFVNPSDGITFNVSSPSGFTINNTGIQLVVNGVDVSANLAISGSASSKTVAYYGLQSNLVYTASVAVRDAFNLTASASTYFETMWVGVPPLLYVWEAEDFDFTNGMYLDLPTLCGTAGSPTCYFGKVGVENVDEYSLGGGTAHLYRPDDLVGTVVSGDFARKDHFLAGVQDYRIDPFQGGEWLNYTRDWSNGTYWVMARLATGEGLAGSLTLSQVNPDTSTTALGTFTVSSGRGWSSYDNVLLKDANGGIASINLSGKTTLRVTSGGNLLPGFFMLAAAQIDLPVMSGLYPDGTQPFEYTNALTFTVTTTGATFPANGIKLSLNGTDVSSRLVITGPGGSNQVVYPGLLPNAIYTAVASITNSLGHGILISNHFDTFSQSNYMVEAEDFDYGGGQFVSPWWPDCYLGLDAATNIDYQHSWYSGEQFPYRAAGIPEEFAHDFLRQSFIDMGAVDYHLAWFGPGDWADYTRLFPAGTFFVYARSAGLGSNTMYLDQVVSGAGTGGQSTSRLGRWTSTGLNNQAHDWVPLTDDGLVAPVTLRLGGQTTVRLSTPTGVCYPSYFMLVPAAGIAATATKSRSNANISFPTQDGVLYRVFYRDSLATGTWTLLSTILGDGSVKTASDPSVGAQRFYRIVAP